MNELLARDIIRLADAKLSLDLWQRQKNGEKIFKSDYDPDERIKHYSERIVRYAGYVERRITEGSKLSDVINFIKKVFDYLPEGVKSKLLNYIISLFKKI